MARKFEDLRREMSPERRERNEARAAAMLAAIELAELRGSLEITQEELAERLSVAQSNVSRLEHRRDMLLSTLNSVVAALGGELHVSAVFDDGAVDLLEFEEATA